MFVDKNDESFSTPFLPILFTERSIDFTVGAKFSMISEAPFCESLLSLSLTLRGFESLILFDIAFA